VERRYVLGGLAIPRDGGVVGVGIVRAIAWKATGASLDDIVLAVLVLVPVNFLEERLRLEERVA